MYEYSFESVIEIRFALLIVKANGRPGNLWHTFAFEMWKQSRRNYKKTI